MTCPLESIFESAAKEERERSEYLSAYVNTLARASDSIKKLLQLETEVNTQPAQSALNKIILDLKEIHDQSFRLKKRLTRLSEK